MLIITTRVLNQKFFRSLVFQYNLYSCFKTYNYISCMPKVEAIMSRKIYVS